MNSFSQWLEEQSVQEGRLSDMGRAGATALGILGGSLFPPYNVAGAERPAMQQSERPEVPASVSMVKKPFNPRIGPQPRNKNSDALAVWKHQLRFVQEQERLMRFGKRPDPDYYVLVHYYNNQWPSPPVE